MERPAASNPSRSSADDPLIELRGIADDTSSLVSSVRTRRRAARDCTATEPEPREQMDRLDARFAALRSRRDGELRAVMSGASMVLASARACTSCNAVATRQCEQFDAELAELRRSIDQ